MTNKVYLIGNKETATYMRRSKAQWARSLTRNKALTFIDVEQANAHCKFINNGDIFPEEMHVIEANRQETNV